MTTQIAVRLPDDLVEYLDRQVHDGTVPSRAALIRRAIERDRRRDAVERDNRILAALDGDPYPDLAGLIKSTAHRPLGID